MTCKIEDICNTHMCVTCFDDCPCLNCEEEICQWDTKLEQCLK
jgi:hypothetical protein